jgi:hypothetical protein
MVKAVGARTCRWLHRAAIARGAVGVMVVLVWLHALTLPDGSVLGGVARLPFQLSECGRTHCGSPWKGVIVSPDRAGGWTITETQEMTPGSVYVSLAVFRDRRGLGAPTCTVISRSFAAYDEFNRPTTLLPGAAAAARGWYEDSYRRGFDLDEAIAGRTVAIEPVPGAHVHNALLILQGVGVLLCMGARAGANAQAASERRRRRAGLCERCAYPVLEGACACPECGEPYEPASGERSEGGPC